MNDVVLQSLSNTELLLGGWGFLDLSVGDAQHKLLQ
jgi:hypothetical protein